MTFDIRGGGVFLSELRGGLNIAGDEIRAAAHGDFAGQTVALSLIADRQTMLVNNREPVPTAPHLREVLVVGMTRIGLLHNLARLSGDLEPDHSQQGIGDWLAIPAVGESGDRLIFDIHVSGTRAACATLDFRGATATTLPSDREQIVYFDEGEMNVSESYTVFEISKKGYAD